MTCSDFVLRFPCNITYDKVTVVYKASVCILWIDNDFVIQKCFLLIFHNNKIIILKGLKHRSLNRIVSRNQLSMKIEKSYNKEYYDICISGINWQYDDCF